MMQALRSIYIWVGIAVLTSLMYVVGAPMFIATMAFDPQRKIGHWYAQRWGRLITKLNNRWSFEVVNPEAIPSDRAMVVVSNHQGMGDIMMAFCMELHFKWISKATNFLVPCMGWFMYHAGYIPLRRGNKTSVLRCMARARKYIDDGVSVLFFPEGTRSKDGNVKEFKGGAFKLAIESQCDILPLAITGTANALPKHTWKFSNEPTAMRLIVGKPISTKGMSEADMQRLMATTRETVIALKAELEGRALPAAIERKQQQLRATA